MTIENRHQKYTRREKKSALRPSLEHRLDKLYVFRIQSKSYALESSPRHALYQQNIAPHPRSWSLEPEVRVKYPVLSHENELFLLLQLSNRSSSFRCATRRLGRSLWPLLWRL